MNQNQVSVIAKVWIMLLVWSFWFFEMKKNLFGFWFACSMKYSPKARILNAQLIHFLPPDWVRINQSNDSIWIPMWKLFFENDGGTIDRLWCSQAADCQQISRCWWTRSRSMESCLCKGKPFNSYAILKVFLPKKRSRTAVRVLGVQQLKCKWLKSGLFACTLMFFLFKQHFAFGIVFYTKVTK